MKLPTFRQVFRDAGITLRRFPLVIADALIATVAAIILIDHEGVAEPTQFFRVLLAGILGIPWLLALALLLEKSRSNRLVTWLVQGAGVLVLVGFAFSLPADLPHAPLVFLYRFFILVVAMHLLVAVIPFVGRGELNGFWQHNRFLFLRILLTALFAGILYAGLSIALASFDKLFGMDIPAKRYFELWACIAGLFTTWFFLAGIPEDLRRLDEITEFPRSLKVLAQYIVLPIVAVYFAILYAYLGKILIEWKWPDGWVSKLILGFSGTGIFSLLLLHPAIQSQASPRMANLSRWFYRILVPMIVVLFFALARRTGEYGMTEDRYLAYVLGGWLAGVVLYFTFSKRGNIKVLPASLCLIALLVSYGPWSAFTIARKSQVGRLEQLATRNGILTDGKIQKKSPLLSGTDAKEICAILTYLQQNHGFADLQKWFDENLKEQPNPSSEGMYRTAPALAEMMGVEYVSPGGWAQDETITLKPDGAYPTAGYEKMTVVYLHEWNSGDTLAGCDGIRCYFNRPLSEVRFLEASTTLTLFALDLRAHADSLISDKFSGSTISLPPDRLALKGSTAGVRAMVCPQSMVVRRHGGKTSISVLDAAILFAVEKK